MKAPLATSLIMSALVAGCAQTPQPPANLPPPPAQGAGLASGQCFRSSDMRGHKVVDASTMLVRARSNVYRLTFAGSCAAGAVSSDPIVTRVPPGSATVCRPLDLSLSIAKGGFPTPCIVSSIDMLTPEQVAELPKRLRP